MQSPDVICVPLESQHDFELAARLISRDNDLIHGPPIQVLLGTVLQVKDLSLYMLHRCGDLDGFGIKVIQVGRHMLSPRWEQRLRSWWNAEIVRDYGCSELSMCGARSCNYCDYYHLAPTCVGEVIDISRPERYVMAGERGALVVTAFHPYVEFEPRIRYRPGDVVELAAQPCPGWGELGFRPLGRERYCFPANDGTKIVTPADCFRVIADLPEVAVRHEDHHLSGLAGYSHESGSPRFGLRRDSGITELHVELRFDPLVWKDEAAKLERRVRDEIGNGISVVMHKQGELTGFYFV